MHGAFKSVDTSHYIYCMSTRINHIQPVGEKKEIEKMQDELELNEDEVEPTAGEYYPHREDHHTVIIVTDKQTEEMVQDVTETEEREQNQQAGRDSKCTWPCRLGGRCV